MSSFRQTQTEMCNQDILVKTLKGLGYNPQVSETKQTVRGHGSETNKAEIRLTKEELKDGGDIGLSKNKDGNFSFVMDTYVMRKTDYKKLMTDVKQGYTTNMVKEVARKNNWTLLNTKAVDKNGKSVTRLQYVVNA